MAIRNLEVVVTVTDKASKDLDKLSQRVRRTGRAAKDASVDFTGFNRTLFATTAFVGTFLKAFHSLGRAFEEGANLDRLSNQFERILGPKSHLSSLLLSFTDTFVDEFEAMRQGIALKNLGIVGSIEQTAEIFARASVAAKQAGKESAEGIKQYSDFLKDGNVSHLQFLNLISQTNPALQAQMAILGKTGGVMSNVISTQARLALGQRLLFLATKDNMKSGRDLTDTLRFLGEQWKFLRGELGRLLLTALQPVLDSTALLINKFRLMIDNIRANEKHLVFLTKVVVIATTSVLGLAGALGTLRLATIALTSLGFGLPRLLFLVTTLGTAFLGITSRAEKLVDKLRVFGAFIKGVYQLVTTLDTKTGIAKIDEDIKQLLEENGILVFAQNVARAISVVKTVVGDMIDAFSAFASTTDRIFGGLGRSFINMISQFKEPWQNFWVSEAATPVQKFTRTFAVLGAGLATVFTVMVTKSVLGKFTGLLSKIPVIGRLFGRAGGAGPSGTKSDPMYVRNADGSLGIATGAAGMGGAADRTAGGIMSILKNFITTGPATRAKELARAFTTLATTLALRFPKTFGLVFDLAAKIGTTLAKIPILGRGLAFLGRGLLSFIPAITTATGAFAVFAAAFAGFKLGEIIEGWLDKNTQGKTEEGFEGNIVERGLFKLFGSEEDKKRFSDFEKFKTASDSDLIAQHKARASAAQASKQFFDQANLVPNFMGMSTAGAPGEKTSTTIPTLEEQREDVDILGEHLKTLTGAQRKQAQQAVEDALKADSAGGEMITAEEMEAILRGPQTEQLDLLGQIAENTRPIKNKGVMGTRRD